MHSFVKCLFRDMSTNFYWNRFIFDRHRAKYKLAQFLLRHRVHYTKRCIIPHSHFTRAVMPYHHLCRFARHRPWNSDASTYQKNMFDVTISCRIFWPIAYQNLIYRYWLFDISPCQIFTCGVQKLWNFRELLHYNLLVRISERAISRCGVAVPAASFQLQTSPVYIWSSSSVDSLRSVDLQTLPASTNIQLYSRWSQPPNC